MATNRYIALLRGINVGGRNAVSMAALKLRLEREGLAKVRTYINSGNVVFESAETSAKLAARIEKALAKKFRFEIKVVIRSRSQLASVIKRAPRGFGTQPTKFRSDVIFIRSPLTPTKAMKTVATKQGVDTVASGPGVLYFARLTSKATQSRMGRIIGTPEYQNMTIRSWSTTTKLLALLDELAKPGKNIV